MKKLLLAMAFITLKTISLAQISPTAIKILKGNTVLAPVKKVLYDIKLNYIAVAEATRNRIDNGDCKRVGGSIFCNMFEIDNSNQKIAPIETYENGKNSLFLDGGRRTNELRPFGLSYFEDRLDTPEMSKITFNVPEHLLINRRVLLEVYIALQTGHKDNDFASYDFLQMRQKKEVYILNNEGGRTEIIQGSTDPSQSINNSDDIHKIWVSITCKKN